MANFKAGDRVIFNDVGFCGEGIITRAGKTYDVEAGRDSVQPKKRLKPEELRIWSQDAWTTMRRHQRAVSMAEDRLHHLKKERADFFEELP